MYNSFSKWPGAWERHLIRRYEYPQYFEGGVQPTTSEIANAQARDQQELAEFHSALQSLIFRCTQLTDDSGVESVSAVKKELDVCHDTAFGLATDLTEQITAIAALNEILTTSMQRSLTDTNESGRLQLIQGEASRMEQQHRLEYPIVCDILRAVSPIPKGEMTGALLSESNHAYKAALEIFNQNRKAYIAQRIDIIIASLVSGNCKDRALKRLELLQKQLPETPAANTTTDKPVAV